MTNRNYPQLDYPQLDQGGVPEPPKSTFELAAYGKRVLRNWYWLALALALGIAAAFLYVRQETPVYGAAGKMLIAEGESTSAISTEALGQSLGFESSYNLENEIQYLKSSLLMRRVVDSLQLNYRYVRRGSVRDDDIYHPPGFGLTLADSITYDEREPVRYGQVRLLFRPGGEIYDITTGDTLPFKTTSLLEVGNHYFVLRREGGWGPPAEDEVYTFRWEDPRATAQRYANALRVGAVGKSNVVALRIEDTSPRRAADILNATMHFYDQSIIEENAETGAQTLDFIQERLASVSRDLFAVETRLEGYKRNNSLAVGIMGAAENYLSRINAFDTELAELQVKGDIIEEVLRLVNRPSSSFEPIPISSEIIDGALAGLITNYNDLVFQRAQKLETATIDNPAVTTFAERIDNLRGTLRRSLNSLLQENRERQRRIELETGPLEASLTAIPQSERVLIQLERERKIKESLFLFLSQRHEETAITVAAKTGNVRVIEPATPNYLSSWPRPRVTYAFAGLMALFLPLGILGVIEVLDTRIKTEDDIKEHTSVPILGKIVQGAKVKGLAMQRDSRSATAEMFRLLRTSLSITLGRQASSVVLVTSGSSGEGKSYITANLGAAAALAKRRVLIVEGDLRRPSLAIEVTGKREPEARKGFAELLLGEVTLSEVVAPTDLPGLSLLTVGGTGKQVSNLMAASDHLGAIVAAMRAEYELIIFDMAPVTLVTDALLMREYVDASLYVVRAGLTPKASIGALNDYVREEKLGDVGIVLNGIPLDTKSYYGGYKYYQGK